MWETGSSGSLADLATFSGEVQVLLELRLDQRLVVREDEAATLAALFELRRPGRASSLTPWAQSVNSPLVVYRSAPTPGLNPGTAGSVSVPVRAT